MFSPSCLPRYAGHARDRFIVTSSSARTGAACVPYNESLCFEMFPILLNDKIISYFQEMFKNISAFLKVNGNMR